MNKIENTLEVKFKKETKYLQMKIIKSISQDIFNFILFIFCYLQFRIANSPQTSFGIICVFTGLLFQISYKWWDKKFYNNYSIVSVKKTKPYVINNRIMLPKTDIKTMF